MSPTDIPNQEFDEFTHGTCPVNAAVANEDDAALCCTFMVLISQFFWFRTWLQATGQHGGLFTFPAFRIRTSYRIYGLLIFNWHFTGM